jgi:hypothetical protein
MRREIHIRSYFSMPTDLAKEMGEWPEFVSGEGYSVDLSNAATGEKVTVRLSQNGGDGRFVAVAADEAGALFDRVLGRVLYALSEHSDDLMVDNHA